MMSSKLPDVIKIEWVKWQIVIFVEGKQQFSCLIRSKDEYGLWLLKLILFPWIIYAFKALLFLTLFFKENCQYLKTAKKIEDMNWISNFLK